MAVRRGLEGAEAMIRGTLVCESLRVGSSLEDLQWTVRGIRRVGVGSAAPDQPNLWTLIDFEVADDAADGLAECLAGVLDEPGWYVDYHTESDKFIVFAGRTFKYRRGQVEGRQAAADYARSHGVPEAQIDWPE